MVDNDTRRRGTRRRRPSFHAQRRTSPGLIQIRTCMLPSCECTGMIRCMLAPIPIRVIDARHLRPLLIAHLPLTYPLIGRILIEDKSFGGLVVEWWTVINHPRFQSRHTYIYVRFNEVDRLRINKLEEEGRERETVSIGLLITPGDKVSRDGDRLTGCWFPSQFETRIEMRTFWSECLIDERVF